jgi:hypothetical protein
MVNYRDTEWVRNWIKRRKQMNDRKVHFSFGSDDNWIICTSQGICAWSDGFSESDQSTFQLSNPVIATVGFACSYVLLDKDGIAKWNLQGHYSQLNDTLYSNSLATVEVGFFFFFQPKD